MTERPPGVGQRGVVRALLPMLVLLLTGCVVEVGTTGTDRRSAPSPATAPPPTSSTGSAVPAEGVELLRTPGELAVTLPATAESLREYWSAELPRVYDTPFEDLAGGVQPKTESSEPWTCGGQPLTYAEVEGNAFYCGGPQDDYIAYDAASLLPRLNEQFGALTPSVVLAHEMGHAVQARVGVDAPSVVQELQADCFAGAWVAFAERSDSDPVAVAPTALDSSVRAIPALRDQPGTPAGHPRAHGLGFDRVNAYQTGYESGASRCAEFPRGRVVVTELPFQTTADAQSGGDLPYAETVQFAVDSLEAFWSAALPRLGDGTTWRSPEPVPSDTPLPECGDDDGYDPAAVAAYCSSSNAVAWADPVLARLHDSLGDVAAASALSTAWARAGQVQAGSPGTGPEAELQQVCFTGAWLSTVPSGGDAAVSLSPGDIDEGLFAVLSPLAPSQRENVESSSFERADAYRAGLLGGPDEC